MCFMKTQEGLILFRACRLQVLLACRSWERIWLLCPFTLHHSVAVNDSKNLSMNEVLAVSAVRMSKTVLFWHHTSVTGP